MEIYVNSLSIYLIICLLANIIQLCRVWLIAHECDPHFPSVTCQLKEIFHLCHDGLLCCEFHIRPPNSNNWRQFIFIARTTLKFPLECKAKVWNIQQRHWKYITMASENDWKEFYCAYAIASVCPPLMCIYTSINVEFTTILFARPSWLHECLPHKTQQYQMPNWYLATSFKTY